jgi:alginate O-acetyltransferase complex protein AlgI
MLFNSIEYFVFFLFIFIVYWAISHSFRKAWLLIASWLFYASWSPSFLIHFILVLFINYLFLVGIAKYKRNYPLLVSILVLNFINLAFFKYFYFLVDILKFFSSWDVLARISLGDESILPKIILPLAISFYTFQIVAFHVDVYRKEVDQVPSMKNYFLFIMFFPQLIAGPIVRHNELLPQLDERKTPKDIDLNKALGLIGIGIVKKAVIADFLSPTVALISQNPSSYTSASILTSIYFFSLVVYCDFAGYTDLARGSALLLGFTLPYNFRGPFFQMSFTDHWKRWHLTLTSWIRDYIYVPLGGNKLSVSRTFLNSIITFFLAGLWHGAGWGFAIWGFVNGFALSMERLIYKDLKLVAEPATWANASVNGKIVPQKLAYRIFKFLLIYSTIAIVGIFFNAGTDMERAMAIWTGLLTNGSQGISVALTGKHFFVVILFLFLHYLEYNDFFLQSKLLERIQSSSRIWIPVASIVILLYCSAYVDSDIPFVYFQF